MGDRQLSRATDIRPLEGLRILECGHGASAPFCTRILADFGAEVLKIEPAGGDPSRAWGPLPDGAAEGTSGALFAFLNAGKRSVALSGDAAKDGALVASLAADADAVVTNLAGPEASAWGIAPHAFADSNPDLVLLDLSAYRRDGDRGDAAGHTIGPCAVGGMSVILGEPDQGPLSFPAEIPALQAGLHGAAALLTALISRSDAGDGQRVEVTEADVLSYYSGGMSLFILGSGGKWKRRGFERHGAMYPSGFYPCQDGFVFLATQKRSQWEGFLRLMGDPDFAKEDPDLADGAKIGWKRADEVDVYFIPWLAQYTRRELTEMAAREGLILGPINEAPDVLESQHLVDRSFWFESDVAGKQIKLPGMGYVMSETPWSAGPVPALGEAGPAPTWSERADLPCLSRRSGGDGPLAGYRVVEFGFNWAGPMVGQILAEMGMEVIKIEASSRLDFMRHWKHARAFFHNANRGKLSAAVNIQRPEGQELVRRLAGKADVFFDNFAAGILEKHGLGPARLRDEHPELIVMSMAMAGQFGSMSHLRGFATIATGFAGIEAAIGYPKTGPTGLPSIGMGDVNAAIQGVISVLVALWHRGRTGRGQTIDLSQIEAATTLSADLLARYQIDGSGIGPQANHHDRLAPYGLYPALGEDRWVSLAVDGDDQWAALGRALGRPDWASTEAWATLAGRAAASDEIDRLIGEWTAQRERDEIVQIWRAAGLEAAPMLEIEEMHECGPLAAHGSVSDVTSFEGKNSRVYHTPWRLGGTPGTVGRPSPRVGEHNDYVFRELVGLSAEELARLDEAEVTR